MNLKTKLYLSSLVSVVLVFALVIVLIHGSRDLAEKNRERMEGQHVLQSTSELNILTYEYLLHHGNEAERLWQEKYEEIGRYLKDLEEADPDPEVYEAQGVAELTNIYKDIKGSFDRLMSASETRQALLKNGASEDQINAAVPQSEALMSEYSLLLQTMVKGASDLNEYHIELMLSTVYFDGYVILLFCALMLLSRFVTVVSVQRVIVSSLRELRSGVLEIGRGNLHYKINIDNKDELGQLALAFNAMANNLRSITSSKAELERAMSHLKYAEETIRKDKILLDQTGEIAKLGGWELDVATMNLTWTDETYKIYGVDKSTYEPNYDREINLFSPESKSLIEKAVEDAIAYGTSFDLELEFITGEGVHKITRAIGNTETENEKVKRIYGIFQDITERRQAEDRLKNFISVLAHEMRNPLSPILTEVELLKMRDIPKEDTELKEAIGIIERQTNTMAKLLKDLLDVSRLEKGKVVLAKSNVELSSVIKNAIETTQPIFSHANQILSVSFPPEEIILTGDPLRIEQIVINILNNASKYSGEKTQIELRLEKQGNTAVITVKDQGVGIPPESIESIFGLFSQNETMSRLKGGLGVGLHLSRDLAQLHEGTITARSAGPGKGSEFTITFPL